MTWKYSHDSKLYASNTWLINGQFSKDEGPCSAIRPKFVASLQRVFFRSGNRLNVRQTFTPWPQSSGSHAWPQIAQDIKYQPLVSWCQLATWVNHSNLHCLGSLRLKSTIISCVGKKRHNGWSANQFAIKTRAPWNLERIVFMGICQFMCCHAKYSKMCYKRRMCLSLGQVSIERNMNHHESQIQNCWYFHMIFEIALSLYLSLSHNSTKKTNHKTNSHKPKNDKLLGPVVQRDYLWRSFPSMVRHLAGSTEPLARTRG